METRQNPKVLYSIIGLVGLVLGSSLSIGGMFLSGNFNPKPVPVSQKSTASTQTPAEVARIDEAVAATSIDKDGKAINPTDTFNSTTDKSIYVIGVLKNVSKGSKVEYVRYLNGKYLDSKVAIINKDGLKYYSFVWTTKTNQNEHPAGVYTVKLYLNGDANDAITYVVK